MEEGSAPHSAGQVAALSEDHSQPLQQQKREEKRDHGGEAPSPPLVVAPPVPLPCAPAPALAHQPHGSSQRCEVQQGTHLEPAAAPYEEAQQQRGSAGPSPAPASAASTLLSSSSSAAHEPAGVERASGHTAPAQDQVNRAGSCSLINLMAGVCKPATAAAARLSRGVRGLRQRVLEPRGTLAPSPLHIALVALAYVLANAYAFVLITHILFVPAVYLGASAYHAVGILMRRLCLSFLPHTAGRVVSAACDAARSAQAASSPGPGLQGRTWIGAMWGWVAALWSMTLRTMPGTAGRGAVSDQAAAVVDSAAARSLSVLSRWGALGRWCSDGLQALCANPAEALCPYPPPPLIPHWQQMLPAQAWALRMLPSAMLMFLVLVLGTARAWPRAHAAAEAIVLGVMGLSSKSMGAAQLENVLDVPLPAAMAAAGESSRAGSSSGNSAAAGGGGRCGRGAGGGGGVHKRKAKKGRHRE